MKIKDMTTEHLKNRINWLDRHKIDEWDIHGYDDKYESQCGYTVFLAQDFNEKIDKEIDLLEKELKSRIKE